MEIEKIKTNKKELESNIESLINYFIQKNNVEIDVNIYTDYATAAISKEVKHTGTRCVITALIR